MNKVSEHKELTENVYKIVLSNDYNSANLQLIEKYIEDARPENGFKRFYLSQRLPRAVERSLYERKQRDVIREALFSRICESTVSANECFSKNGRREIEEQKKEALKAWAIATNNWYTDLSMFTNDVIPISSGTDSDVYISKDGFHVIKTSKGKPYGKRFRPDIDQLALFNYVFPNTAYEILGYGEINRKFVRFLKQIFVDFSKDVPLTAKERKEYMHSFGFRTINDACTAFSNGEIIVSDLQKSNVVRSIRGNIRVIDADMKLHTKDVGGKYSYQL